MKKFVFLTLVLLTGPAMAERITLLDTRVPVGYNSYATSKFYMDTQSEQGFAQVRVMEEYLDRYPGGGMRCDRYGCYPAPAPIPRLRVIYSDTIEIDNLKLVDKEMIYSDGQREINCGKLGISRVLRKPTLYLTGNCKLVESLRYDRLTVSLLIN